MRLHDHRGGRCKQGQSNHRNIGYHGPCPPPILLGIGSESEGQEKQIEPPHRYYFRLYDLDAELGLSPGASKVELLDAMEGHILAQANTMGKYTRPIQLRAFAGATPTPDTE